MEAGAARKIPAQVREMGLGERIRWARKTAGLSHDRLVEKIGRSNRGHLIKIEQGTHTPGPELRNAIADATNVPRDLFTDEDDEEADSLPDLDVALRSYLRRLIREEASA